MRQTPQMGLSGDEVAALLLGQSSLGSSISSAPCLGWLLVSGHRHLCPARLSSSGADVSLGLSAQSLPELSGVVEVGP